MITHGAVALLGGLEHLDGCEPIDRMVMAEVGASRPNVVVVPAASSRRLMPAAAVLARGYWQRLGAAVTVGVPGGNLDERLAEAVDTADIVVFTGGHPNKLFARMGASLLWDQIIRRWEAGAALVGSSAGAMCLFEQRLNLYPPNPLKLIPGLGPLNGFATAPHFDRLRARTWAPWVIDRTLHPSIIGLDEGTGLVGRDGEFRVEGRGNVTVVRPGDVQVYPAGADVPVRLTQAVPESLVDEYSAPVFVRAASAWTRSPVVAGRPLTGAGEI
jgi:cyanophycinase-like exopeptidase